MNPVSTETIRLICLDFDGTCVGYGEDGSAFLESSVIAFLNRAGEDGVEWCTNSGRTLESQLDILEVSRQRGLKPWPEALMCGESFLFLRQVDRYLSHEAWNRRAEATLTAFHRDLQAQYGAQLREIGQRYGAERLVFEDSATAYLLPTADPLVLGECLRDLNRLLEKVPSSYASRNGGWVFVGHSDFGKGRVLEIYIRERGLSGHEVLAVGDNLNDVEMLDGRVCRHVGCPGDSIAEVKDVVARASGIIATEPGPAGTLQVLRHYLRDY